MSEGLEKGQGFREAINQQEEKPENLITRKRGEDDKMSFSDSANLVQLRLTARVEIGKDRYIWNLS
jgi:hypothetical protein